MVNKQSESDNFIDISEGSNRHDIVRGADKAVGGGVDTAVGTVKIADGVLDISKGVYKTITGTGQMVVSGVKGSIKHIGNTINERKKDKAA